MSLTPPKDNGDTTHAECQLLPLYVLYPDITFDPLKETETPRRSGLLAGIDSSPISTTAEEGQTSFCSNSTAQTTPLRHQLFQPRNLVAHDTIESYLHSIQHADLPGQCLQYFTNLAQSIDTISSGLIPSTNGQYRINNTFFLDLCDTLFTEIKAPLDKTTEQITQIGHLQSLIIFQATTTDRFAWATYRQRAELIVRLTALPSLTERHLIQHLARLYDSSVYQPAQQLYDEDEIETQAMSILNVLYDALFTWPHRYKQWCNSMKDLKERYMQPLMERILASDSIVAEIKQFHQARTAAQKAIDNPNAPGVLPIDDRVLKALNLSARRRETHKKTPKRRFRRQLTI